MQHVLIIAKAKSINDELHEPAIIVLQIRAMAERVLHLLFPCTIKAIVILRIRICFVKSTHHIDDIHKFLASYLHNDNGSDGNTGMSFRVFGLTRPNQFEAPLDVQGSAKGRTVYVVANKEHDESTSNIKEAEFRE